MLCWSSKKTSSQCSIRDFFMESIPTTEIKTYVCNMHYIWLFCSLDLIHNYIERLQQTAVEPFPPGLLRLSPSPGAVLNTTFTNFLCQPVIVLNQMQNLILTKMIITGTFHHSVAALLLTSTLPAKWVQSLVGGSVGSPDNMYQANKNTDIYKYRFVDCTNTIPDIYKWWNILIRFRQFCY